MSIKTVFFVFGSILIVAGSAGYISYRLKPAQAPIPAAIKETPKVPTKFVTLAYSLDGDVDANLDATVQDSGSTSYKLSLSNKKSGDTKDIFEEATPVGVTISLPYNSISPDNKYLFIKKEAEGVSSYFIYRVDGQDILEGQKSQDLKSIFDAKITGYSLTDVTGWASETLLIIKAQNNEGGKANFWFEVPTGAIIRLSS